MCISDRNKKKNITPADTSAVLDKVSKLPISTWSYTAEPVDVRHMGPMAQDFRASFGLGDDDKTYNASTPTASRWPRSRRWRSASRTGETNRAAGTRKSQVRSGPQPAAIPINLAPLEFPSAVS